MINVFQLAANDQSIFYLGQIFGPVGGALPVQMTGNASLLVPVMFKVLNTIALTVGTIIVVYTTVVGLLMTAHEGKFLGEKWSGLWVPIRTVGGIAALFPTSTGYSAIQVIIMWIAIQGVGAADTVWTAVLNYAQSVGGNPASTIAVPTTPYTTNMKDIFRGLVCQANALRSDAPLSVRRNQANGATISYYCAGNNDAWCLTNTNNLYDVINGPQKTTPVNNANLLQYNFGSSGACGNMQYCNPDIVCSDISPDNDYKKGPNSLDCLSCKGQQQALQTIVPVLGAIAEQYVEFDHQYAYFYEAPYLNNSSTAATYTPPQWVLNWCAAKGIAAANCCVYYNKSPNPLTPDIEPCEADGAYDAFDHNRDAEDNQQPYDYGNPSNNAVTNLYFPYAMKPYLGTSSDFIDAATNLYVQQAITGPYIEFTANQSASSLTTDWLQQAQVTGWLLAGGYYLKMADNGQQTSQANQQPLDTTHVLNESQLVQGGSNSGNPMASERNNLAAVPTLLDATDTSNKADNPISASNPQLGRVYKDVATGAQAILSMFINSMTPDNYNSSSSTNLVPKMVSGDPLLTAAHAGYQMMVSVQALTFTIVLALGVASALGALATLFVLGNGTAESIPGALIKTMIIFFGPLVALMLLALYICGATLGIYVPFIPFLMYTFSALGWFIALIEAMVAGPLVALGILSPHGQHEIMSKAEPSVLIILNLFLRPTLMVVGLMIAMLFVRVAISLLNAGFIGVTKQIMSNPGLFEQIIFICLYVFVFVTIVNKVFSLIHVLPERVITYISGHAAGHGEAEMMGGAKGAVESGAGGIARGGQSGVGGVFKTKSKKGDDAGLGGG